MQRRQFLSFRLGEAQADQPLCPSGMHFFYEVIDCPIPSSHIIGCPAARRYRHQRIEDFGIETSSMPKRVVTPADGVRKDGDYRWLSRDVLTQVSHTESDVPRFILRCQPAYGGSDRIGSIAFEKPQQR